MFEAAETIPTDLHMRRSYGHNSSEAYPVWHLRWHETVAAYRAAIDGNDSDSALKALTPASRKNLCHRQRDRWEHDSQFYGGTTEEARHYLQNGYRVSELDGSFLPGVLRTREGTAQLAKWRFADSGDEVDVGLALAGVTECFRSYEPQPNIGGMNIRAYMSFSANTDSDIIAQYGAWLARLLSTCSGAGISPSVEIRTVGTGLTNKRPGPFQIAMRIKQENEELDWAAYSAYFSPLGFRHFGFTNLHVTAGAMMRSVPATGLSTPIGADNWKLNWDRATRTLTVLNPRTPDSFPAQELTDQLVQLGALTEA